MSIEPVKENATHYREIYIGVDGSELASAAAEYAIWIGRADNARLYGSHVYAARLHERRFKMMEGGLPEEYREESVLEEQREVHDSLITQGLELITDSYLHTLNEQCKKNGVPFRGISLEGKNWLELVKDLNAGDYDMVALGGHGVGRVAVSQLGTVTERVLRRVRRDIFVCNKSMKNNTSDEIVVCLDGSPRAWGGLKRGIALAKTFDKKVVAISCFDPYFHYSMFNAINKVMTDKAREVFKFEEQEKLHEDIIDSGLARIYQSNLDVATRIGEAEGAEISTRLLDGKAYAKILGFISERTPWLVIMGRIGIHGEEDMDIGGATENVCRMADCNVLVVETKYSPPPEFLSEATVTWTREASAKMDMVPPMARGVAMKAVQNHCLASGHTVVTTEVLNDAIRHLLPAKAIERMGIFGGEEIPPVKQQSEGLSLSFKCETCNHVHHGKRPRLCTVCGTEGKAFKLIDSGRARDGVAVEALGGRQLIWEKRCLEAMEKIDSRVLRDEIRTRVEKRVLTRRMPGVTWELFKECVNTQDTDGPVAEGAPVWTDAAVGRLDRVPEGFMRNAARTTVEGWANDNGLREITLEVAERGLAKAREKMTLAMKDGSRKGRLPSRRRPADDV